MTLSETTYHHGGAFRCCQSAFEAVSPDTEFKHGDHLECKHCPPGSGYRLDGTKRQWISTVSFDHRFPNLHVADSDGAI